MSHAYPLSGLTQWSFKIVVVTEQGWKQPALASLCPCHFNNHDASVWKPPVSSSAGCVAL